MKKRIIGILIVILLMVVSLFLQVLQKNKVTGEWSDSGEKNNENIVTGKFELREYDFLMKGKNNTSLFIKSVDSDDYDELIKTLYPNGIVDWQGQEIGIIENATEVRKNFIDEHTKAYTVIDGITKDVTLEPFYVNLDDLSNKLYNSSFEGENEYLFYKASIDEDVFVFPSEWGNQPFGFIAASEQNSYYIYWYLGIWKIDTNKLTINKLTSDEYNGKLYIDLRNEMGGDDEGYLVWIDSAEISPNNEYIVYRTNRESENSSETSIWKLDLNTGIEKKIIVENLNNDIVGFASDDVIVVGSTNNTRLVNINTLEVKNIEIPQVENMSVQSVKNGKLIYKTYKDINSDYTTILNEIDLDTGKIKELDRFIRPYMALNNVENMSYNDLLYLQNDVDNGHYSWRLKPEEVVYEYWYNLYGIRNGEISNMEKTASNEVIVDYTINNQTYNLLLVQPIKKGNTGIWVVRDCKLLESNEVIQTNEFEYFNVPEEEKVKGINIEGISENVYYVGIKSSLGYAIQYDEESFNLTRDNGKDFYRANIVDIQDKVYFTVEYLEKSYDELKNENKDNMEEFEINDQNGFTVTYIDGKLFDDSQKSNWKWDSDVKTLWYIEANDGTYLIEEHYFFEATEGWGVRIAQMLNTFKIIEK